MLADLYALAIVLIDQSEDIDDTLFFSLFLAS